MSCNTVNNESDADVWLSLDLSRAITYPSDGKEFYQLSNGGNNFSIITNGTHYQAFINKELIATSSKRIFVSESDNVSKSILNNSFFFQTQLFNVTNIYADHNLLVSANEVLVHSQSQGNRLPPVQSVVKYIDNKLLFKTKQNGTFMYYYNDSFLIHNVSNVVQIGNFVLLNGTPQYTLMVNPTDEWFVTSNKSMFYDYDGVTLSENNHCDYYWSSVFCN